MLNTALRNGRQLVLSEGGRMLLHETNRGSNVKQQSTNGNINNNLRKNAIGLHHAASTNQTAQNLSPQKIRMNVIKQKEPASPSPAGGVTKNKVGTLKTGQISLETLSSPTLSVSPAEHKNHLVDRLQETLRSTQVHTENTRNFGQVRTDGIS